MIFESINSTGLELSNADLIRNYLLMNADDQEKLYENYWLYIEKTLRNKMDYSNLDAFFMQYIVYKTSKPVNSRQLYNSFVKLFKSSSYSQESILKELRYYAEIFGAFVYGSDKYSDRINKLLHRLRVLNQTTCYPFLLHVFDDYHQGVITEETVEKVLQFILAYLLRRMVCGVPSNTLRGLFTYLYNRIFKVTSNKQKYYEAINKFLFTVFSKDVIPSATEFERALQKTNIYGNNALCRFLLLDIENGDSKEVLQAENLTIEHIDVYKRQGLAYEESLKKQLYCFRKSIDIIENEDYSKEEYAPYVNGFKRILYTNYANTLSFCGRKIEAIAQYKKAINILSLIHI